MSATIHLLPTAPLAERVLLPGDPGRALLLAQTLLSEPKMFNHNRGLWGYTGPALLDGEPLTIQSTGMGGPSAAIVIAELAELGARTVVRVGTCGGLDASLALGELIVASEAICEDGTSRALQTAARVGPDADLLSRLRKTGSARTGPVVSTDLFYDTPPGTEERWRDNGLLGVEMETATLFALAARYRLRAAALLIVTDLLFPSRQRIGLEQLREAERRLGELAVAALAADAAPCRGLDIRE
jgi:DeoD family purine-nucleoside phosphorylase